MSKISLPSPYRGENTEETVDILLSVVFKLRKELLYALRHLNSDNIENIDARLIDGLEDIIANNIIANAVLTQTLTADYAYIAELTVDELSTSDKVKNYLLGITDDVDYIYIHDQYIEFITATTDGSGTEQIANRDGRKLYWMSENKQGFTYENTGIPVIIYIYEEATKMQVAFEKDPTTGYNTPIIQLGLGDGVLPESGKGYIYKNDKGVHYKYYKSNTGEMYNVSLTDYGIEINPPIIQTHSALNHQDVTITELTILEGVKITFDYRTEVTFAVQIDITASEALSINATLRVDGAVNRTTTKKFTGAYKDQLVFVGDINPAIPLAEHLIDVTLEPSNGSLSISKTDYRLTLTVITNTSGTDLYQIFDTFVENEIGNITNSDTDVSRNSENGDIERIYIAYVENGTAKVKSTIAPYRYNSHWMLESESVGTADDVSILFDGVWERNNVRHFLATEEYPWIFKVNLGTLTAQYWQDSPIELSTTVSKIRSIKGWVPANGDETNDQGLIIYYLKTDGNVYYRNYCIQSDGNRAWEDEREITGFTGTIVDIALFRTNDFRVGFIVQNDDDTIEYVVTERNWSGMSFEPEVFNNPPTISEFTLTQFIKEVFVNENTVETFNSPPTVSDFGINMCTVAERDAVVTVTDTDFSFGGSTFIFTLDFTETLEFKADFISDGISSVFTVTDATLVNNTLTVTIAETFPYTGFTFTLNAEQFKATMSDRCFRTDLGSEFIYEDGGLPEQDMGTFDSPPSITNFNLTQYVKETFVSENEEIFDNPPTVSDFTITILDVNGDPL